MNKIAILYGTNSGNTEVVANKVKDLFDGQADIFNVAGLELDEIKDYTYFVLGTSTQGIGNLQEDWEDFLPAFEEFDFTGKTAAIFALGNGYSFSESFVGSMRELHDAIADKVKIIGQVKDEGYTYDESESLVDGMWLGQPIDEDNEAEKTDERLAAWVSELKKEFK